MKELIAKTPGLIKAGFIASVLIVLAIAMFEEHMPSTIARWGIFTPDNPAARGGSVTYNLNIAGSSPAPITVKLPSEAVKDPHIKWVIPLGNGQKVYPMFDSRGQLIRMMKVRLNNGQVVEVNLVD